MRFPLKISFPVEAGNAAAKKDGFKAIHQILDEQKPKRPTSSPTAETGPLS
jgi:hypothetical protein